MKTLKTVVYSALCSTIIGLNFSQAAHAMTEIKVAVAYTEKAMLNANSTGYSCAQYDNPNAPGVAIEKTLDSLNMTHPCWSNSTLGRLSGQQDSAIRNKINVGIAELNYILRNSNINNVKFTLADSFLIQKNGVRYQEEYKRPTDLKHNSSSFNEFTSDTPAIGMVMSARNQNDNVNANQRILNMIHERRESNKADIVILAVDSFPGGNAATQGLALQQGAESAYNSFAVADVTNFNSPSYVFSHEVFHLIGANHSNIRQQPVLGRIDVVSNNPSLNQDGEIDAWGLSFCGKKGTNHYKLNYKTIMSYGEPCKRNGDNTGSDDFQYTVPILSTLTPASYIRTNFEWEGNNISVKFGEKSGGAYYSKSASRDTKYTTDNARNVKHWAPIVAQLGDNYRQKPIVNKTKVKIDFGPDNLWVPRYNTNDNTFVANVTALILGVFRPSRVSFRSCESNCGNDHWNNIDISSGTSIALNDANGNSTGKMLSFQRPFTGGYFTPFFLEFGYSVGVDDLDNNGTMGMSDALTFDPNNSSAYPVFTISGLKPYKTYNFKAFSSSGPLDGNLDGRGKPQNLNRITVDIQGANRKIISQNTHANVLDFMEFPEIRPDSSGTVTFRLSAEPQLGSKKQVGLNLIEFYEE